MNTNKVLTALLENIASDFTSTSSSETTIFFGNSYRIKIDDQCAHSYTNSCMRTDGLTDFKHREFEIVFPMPIKSSVFILKSLADSVVSGRKYRHGYLHTCEGKQLYRIVKHRTEKILRVIVADADYHVSDEDISPLYSMQYVFETSDKFINRRNTREFRAT
jgi:hypothetical protein